MYVFRCPQCPARVSLGGHMGYHVPTSCLAHTEPVPMERIPESSRERVFLPLDSDKPDGPLMQVGPATVATLKSVGILMPETQHALDWLWRNKDTNGMASAFLKVGGRRCKKAASLVQRERV